MGDIFKKSVGVTDQSDRRQIGSQLRRQVTTTREKGESSGIDAEITKGIYLSSSCWLVGLHAQFGKLVDDLSLRFSGLFFQIPLSSRLPIKIYRRKDVRETRVVLLCHDFKVIWHAEHPSVCFFRFTFLDICFDGKVKRDYKRGSRIKNGSTVLDSHGAREEVRNIALREKICSPKNNPLRYMCCVYVPVGA